MEASIDYLNKVHGDLLDAATRERRGGLEPSRRRGPSGGAIAAALIVLALAGLVGVVAKNGGIGGGSDDAGGAAMPAGPERAVGATGAGAGTGARGEPAPIVEHSTAPLPGPGNTVGDQNGAAHGPDEPISRIIRTAEISVVIPRDAFEKTFSDAVSVAEDNGGFVADSSSRERSGSLTIRVPADSFDQTMKALRDLGDVRSQSVHGEDVTAQYVDLQARLRIAKSRREVLLGLMETATSIEQTIRVQNALDSTQLRIEEIQGQMRLIDDRASLATIRLDLREQGVFEQSEPPNIPSSFERAVDGFFSTVGVIVVGLGYLLPLIAIGLLGWFVASRIRRRREHD
jgi:uncharacterized protein DUF4349